MKPKVLLIEDREATRFGFVRYFSKVGYEVKEAEPIRNCRCPGIRTLHLEIIKKGQIDTFLER
jgi:hypothetical protein